MNCTHTKKTDERKRWKKNHNLYTIKISHADERKRKRQRHREKEMQYVQCISWHNASSFFRFKIHCFMRFLCSLDFDLFFAHGLSLSISLLTSLFPFRCFTPDFSRFALTHTYTVDVPRSPFSLVCAIIRRASAQLEHRFSEKEREIKQMRMDVYFIRSD